MSSKLAKLISVASTALSTEAPNLDGLETTCSENLKSELHGLLELKNGFYAFESALHCFPTVSSQEHTDLTLQQWNSLKLWKGQYSKDVQSCIFFAEDVFGVQFGIQNNAIVTLDPETGKLEKLCNSLEAWATAILEDYEFLTGFPIAHAWQTTHGKLKTNERLIPKTPFVGGGEFTADNMRNVNAVEGMLFRAQIARQIRDLPDGAKIKLVVK